MDFLTQATLQTLNSPGSDQPTSLCSFKEEEKGGQGFDCASHGNKKYNLRSSRSKENVILQQGEVGNTPNNCKPKEKGKNAFLASKAYAHSLLSSLPSKLLCPLLCWFTLLITIVLLSKHWSEFMKQILADKIFVKHVSSILLAALNHSSFSLGSLPKASWEGGGLTLTS